MTKTLLCGSDLGESGARAADVAVAFARDLDLGICLVVADGGTPHVDPHTGAGILPAVESLAQRLSAAREQNLVALAAERTRIEAQGARVSSARVVAGSPREVLINEAKGLKARFIAVGAHARRGVFEDRFFGSTAEHVLRHAPCPVLVAPANPPAGAPVSLESRVIVVGIDGGEASLAALSVALEVAAEASASVEAIYVGPEASVVDKAVAYVRAHAPQAHLAGVLAGVRRSPSNDKPAAVLLDVAKRTQAALLVVGTAGRTGLEHAVLGSVAEDVCRSATLPVLVVRASSGNGRR